MQSIDKQPLPILRSMRATSGHSSGVQCAVMLGLDLWLLLVLLSMTPSWTYGVRAASWVAIVICMYCGLGLFFTPRLGFWSYSTVYFVVLLCFHFGLVAFLAFGWAIPEEFAELAYRWLSYAETPKAILACSIGAVSYVAGVHAASLVRKRLSFRGATFDRAIQSPSVDRAVSERVSVLGAILVFASVGGWFLLIYVQGGASGFFGTYASYLQVSDQSEWYPYVYLFLSLGVAFVAAGHNHRWAKPAILVFILFSLISLPLGLRGEVMIPALAGLAIYSRWKVLIRPAVAILSIVILFALISGLKGVRSSGVQDFQGASVSWAAVGGLSELGHSLRPSVEALKWAQQGEDLRYGATLWAPVERAVFSVVPGVEVEPATEDERLMNVVINKRIGGIGFSPVAEGLVNFSYAGVAVLLSALGFVIARLDRLPVTSYHQALVAAVFLPLLLQVRNAFTFVPFQMLLGLALVAVVARPWMDTRRVVSPSPSHTPGA